MTASTGKHLEQFEDELQIITVPHAMFMEHIKNKKKGFINKITNLVYDTLHTPAQLVKTRRPKIYR